MSFDFSKFVKYNLIGGYNSGTFNEFQVNIFAMNYLTKGQIAQVDFDEIQLILYPPESEEPVV